MLSSRARYALRALVDLSLDEGAGPVLVQDIADRQRIPVKFLQQIMLDLKQAGLLASRKGPGGGYLMAVSPQTISILDVIQSIEGSSLELGCQRKECGCAFPSDCAISEALCVAAKGLKAALAKTTVADLRDRQREMEAQGAQLVDFSI